MLKIPMAARLVATAVAVTPALAQTTAPVNNPPAAGNQAPATMNVKAAEFVTQAANSDMFEIQSSQLALQQTKDSRIRDFAQHMVQDHTAASDKLKAAAKNLTVPATLDQEHTRMLQQLQQTSGNDFNRTYVQMQYEGHQKAVTLFESYAENGDHAELKQFAQQTVPTLRQHLQQITEIRTSMLPPAQVSQNQSGPAGGQFMTQEQQGQWRASKLEGLNVYTNNDEKIGDISELIVDSNGKIQAVVVGVGGFLGIGERDVAIPFDQIKFVNEPRAGTAASNTDNAGTTGASPPGGAATTGNLAGSTVPNPAALGGPANAVGGVNSTGAVTTGVAPADRGSGPDHALLNMTKDQLQAAPVFRYAR